MPYNPNIYNAGGQIPIPSTIEEMIRFFPQLVSAIQRQEQRIAELERKMSTVEVIGGNVNQV